MNVPIDNAFDIREFKYPIKTSAFYELRKERVRLFFLKKFYEYLAFTVRDLNTIEFLHITAWCSLLYILLACFFDFTENHLQRKSYETIVPKILLADKMILQENLPVKKPLVPLEFFEDNSMLYDIDYLYNLETEPHTRLNYSRAMTENRSIAAEYLRQEYLQVESFLKTINKLQDWAFEYNLIDLKKPDSVVIGLHNKKVTKKEKDPTCFFIDNFEFHTRLNNPTKEPIINDKETRKKILPELENSLIPAKELKNKITNKTSEELDEENIENDQNNDFDDSDIKVLKWISFNTDVLNIDQDIQISEIDIQLRLLNDCLFTFRDPEILKFYEGLYYYGDFFSTYYPLTSKDLMFKTNEEIKDKAKELFEDYDGSVDLRDYLAERKKNFKEEEFRSEGERELARQRREEEKEKEFREEEYRYSLSTEEKVWKSEKLNDILLNAKTQSILDLGNQNGMFVSNIREVPNDNDSLKLAKAIFADYIEEKNQLEIKNKKSIKMDIRAEYALRERTICKIQNQIYDLLNKKLEYEKPLIVQKLKLLKKKKCKLHDLIFTKHVKLVNQKDLDRESQKKVEKGAKQDLMNQRRKDFNISIPIDFSLVFEPWKTCDSTLNPLIDYINDFVLTANEIKKEKEIQNKYIQTETFGLSEEVFQKNFQKSIAKTGESLASSNGILEFEKIIESEKNSRRDILDFQNYQEEEKEEDKKNPGHLDSEEGEDEEKHKVPYINGLLANYIPSKIYPFEYENIALNGLFGMTQTLKLHHFQPKMPPAPIQHSSYHHVNAVLVFIGLMIPLIVRASKRTFNWIFQRAPRSEKYPHLRPRFNDFRASQLPLSGLPPHIKRFFIEVRNYIGSYPTRKILTAKFRFFGILRTVLHSAFNYKIFNFANLTTKSRIIEIVSSLADIIDTFLWCIGGPLLLIFELGSAFYQALQLPIKYLPLLPIIAAPQALEFYKKQYLLVGPRGSGKTFLPKVIAGEFNLNLFAMQIRSFLEETTEFEVLEKEIGLEIEQQDILIDKKLDAHLRAVFTDRGKAWRHSLFLFEGFDLMNRIRLQSDPEADQGEEGFRVYRHLISYMRDTNVLKNGNSLFIGTTASLDKFEDMYELGCIVYLTLPSFEKRLNILKMYLSDVLPSTFDWGVQGSLLVGMLKREQPAYIHMVGSNTRIIAINDQTNFKAKIFNRPTTYYTKIAEKTPYEQFVYLKTLFETWKLSWREYGWGSENDQPRILHKWCPYRTPHDFYPSLEPDVNDKRRIFEEERVPTSKGIIWPKEYYQNIPESYTRNYQENPFYTRDKLSKGIPPDYTNFYAEIFSIKKYLSTRIFTPFFPNNGSFWKEKTKIAKYSPSFGYRLEQLIFTNSPKMNLDTDGKVYPDGIEWDRKRISFDGMDITKRYKDTDLIRKYLLDP